MGIYFYLYTNKYQPKSVGVMVKVIFFLTIFQKIFHHKTQRQYFLNIFFCLFFLFVCFLGLNPQHMKVPRLGVESELQLLGLHHSHSNMGSKLHRQPIPQLMAMPESCPTKQGQGSNPHSHDTSRICFPCATTGTPSSLSFHLYLSLSKLHSHNSYPFQNFSKISSNAIFPSSPPS